MCTKLIVQNEYMYILLFVGSAFNMLFTSDLEAYNFFYGFIL